MIKRKQLDFTVLCFVTEQIWSQGDLLFLIHLGLSQF